MTRGNIGFIILVILLLSLIGYILLGGSGGPENAIGENDPTDNIANTEGGPAFITGLVTYQDFRFVEVATAPIIVLEDQAGFIDRDLQFVPSPESQTLGQITSSLHRSPFSYSLVLPIKPRGSLRDVDHDGQKDIGVMVFTIAYWNNIFGDPFLEKRDMFGAGWSTAYTSTKFDPNSENKNEVSGGTYIVYAPEEGEGFPKGFGLDGKLFTNDDPITLLNKGYTVVNMDFTPFSFKQDNTNFTIDLHEPSDSKIADFSGLGYTQAFYAMVAKLRSEYAFTELKQVDWNQKIENFEISFRLAEATRNADLYKAKLSEFLRSIDDGQLYADVFAEEFSVNTSGGIGLSVTEMEDGRVMVSYLLEGGPANRAGIQLGAKILAINDEPIESAIQQSIPWFEHSSTPEHKKVQQIRSLMRFPLNTAVKLNYQNPGGALTTTKLQAVAEDDSLTPFIPDAALNDFGPPLEYQLLADGYGYVRIYRFPDNSQLAVQLWEHLLTNMNNLKTPGLIMDMRYNRGGNLFLADQMSAYLFNEPQNQLESGPLYMGRYESAKNNFQPDLGSMRNLYLPPPELRYHGDISVLVGPDCKRECELFVNNLATQERAEIIGRPTAGQSGSLSLLLMPEGQVVRYTSGRAIGPSGEIQIEGQGIQIEDKALARTINVPVSAKTISSQGDDVLDKAVRELQHKQGMVSTPTPMLSEIPKSYLIWATVRIPDTILSSTVPPSNVLNVYRDPRLDSKILGTIRDGSTHIIQDISPDQTWFLISVAGKLSDNQPSGWVQAEFIRYGTGILNDNQ